MWVAAVPQTWNAVPNARDVMHGTTFTRAQTTFPTVVYRRYTKDWRKPVTLAYERRAGATQKNGCSNKTRVTSPGRSPANETIAMST